MKTKILSKSLYRVLTALLSAVMIMTSVTLPVLAEGESLKGSGKETDPYLIENAEDLAAFRDKVNNGENTICAKLTNDITLSGNWTPFAYKDAVKNAFAGTFDGDNHTIKGLNVKSGSSGGLFGTVNGATIKNLKVEGTVNVKSAFVGGIIGKTQGEVTVQNCSFSGSVTGTKSSSAQYGVGGIVGKVNAGTLTIENCANFADVTGDGSCTGGILGYSTNQVTISNCYNTGSINGLWYPSGILANGTNKNSKIENCYNIGKITNKNTATNANNAGISANFKGTATKCYRTQPKTESYASNQNGVSDLVSSADALLTNLGNAFTKDTNNINNGYPILKWQASGTSVKTEPSISIDGGTTLNMTNNGTAAKTTLTVRYKDMGYETPKVTWLVESGNDKIDIAPPANATKADNQMEITAREAGSVKIKASVTYESKEYAADAAITIYPCVTFAEVAGRIIVGETVRAKVTVYGDREYDYENYPKLKYQWYKSDDYTMPNKAEAISGATGREYKIPDDMAGKYIWVEVTAGSEKANIGNQLGNNKVGSLDKKLVEDDAAKIPFDSNSTEKNPIVIKEEKKLTLPNVGDSQKSKIEWISDNSEIINAETGAVTLPETGTVTVKLSAKVTYKNEFTNKWYYFKVYSQKQIDEDKANVLLPVKDTLDALRGGYGYVMYPEFDKDTNALDMFKANFNAKAKALNKDTNGTEISIKSIETTAGGENSKIELSGDITYYYENPNTTPMNRFGRHDVTFEIKYKGETTTFKASVIVYWDVDKVKAAMKSEVMDKISMPKNEQGKTITEKDLSLPKVIDDKKWALISWTSSNEKYLSISNKNQQTADTLFNPYVGVIKRGAKDTEVTLTATCTFGYTNDVGGNEKPITLTYTYPITVKAIDAAAAEEIKKGLDEKLDTGFKKAGLTDAVTGEKLSADESGKITVTNDIKFPTTRDFGIDGKEFPVSITIDNHDVVITPDVNNAARVEVIRPAVGKSAATAKITLSVTDKNTNVSASREYTIEVPALTKSEIDAEKALMAKVKDAYFDGIRGANTDKNDIGSNLRSFTEVYEENGELKWVRDNKSMVGHGIVPTPLDGWYDLQAWRLFRSSNPAVISHENLLVTKQTNGKSVTVDSALSSETLGKYGELYNSDKTKYADYKDLEELYYQPVSVELTVRGTSTRKGVKPTAVSEKINVSFTLMDNKKTLIDTVEYNDQDETITVYDIFKKAMDANKYTYEKQGTYIPSITMPDGTKLGALDRGQNSGWMYKVNGKIPDVSMGAYGLSDGDKIIVFYTNDYTKESGMSHYGGGSSGGKNNNTNTSDQNKNDDTLKPNENNDNSAISFDDVKTDGWYYKAVSFVCGKNIMRGTGEKLFEPDGLLNRAMFVTILYRMESEPSASAIRFSDVKNGEWYTKAVAWASENGIVNGISDSEFAPEDNITREQMAAIIYRYIKFKGEDVSVGENTNILSYDDAEDISEYAIPAFCYVGGAGIMSGRTQSTLNPTGTATRAEAATVIMRMFDNGLVK